MKKTSKWTELLVGLFLLVAGGLFLAQGIYLLRDFIDKSNRFVKTTGTVIYLKTDNGLLIDYYRPGDYDDSYSFSAVVEYEVDGAKYEITEPSKSNPPQYRIGQKVDIKYNPENPKEAIFRFGNGLWIVLLVGTLFPVCGGALLIHVIVSKKEK